VSRAFFEKALVRRVTYVSTLKGEAFEATSSDGRSVSGREEWNYATASGDELRLFFDWKGTKR
jgi:hypothetical protein